MSPPGQLQGPRVHRLFTAEKTLEDDSGVSGDTGERKHRAFSLWDGLRQGGVATSDHPTAREWGGNPNKLSVMLGKYLHRRKFFEKAAPRGGRSGCKDNAVYGLKGGSCVAVGGESPDPTARKIPLTLVKFQVLPSLIIYPDSPVRRLVGVLPPGAGKSCIIMKILDNFLHVPDYDILIIADPATQLSLRNEAAQKCPSALFNPTTKARIKDPFAGWPARVEVISYVQLGNYMRGVKTRKGGSPGGPMMFDVPNTIIICDEFHLLVSPQEAPESWRDSIIFLGETLVKYGPSPIIVGFTATPIISDPVQAVCMAAITKGRTDPSLFSRVDPEKGLWEGRYVNPRTFLRDYCVSIADVDVDLGRSDVRVPLEDVMRVLREQKCLPLAALSDEQTTDGSQGTHPCNISKRETSPPAPLKLTDDPVKLAHIDQLFSNLFYVVDSAKDWAVMPRSKREDLWVDAPSRDAETALMGKSTAKFPLKTLSYNQRTALLNDYRPLESKVRSCLITLGQERGEMPSSCARIVDGKVEDVAPKWDTVLRSLKERKGKAVIYMGLESKKAPAYLYALAVQIGKECNMNLGFLYPSPARRTAGVDPDNSVYVLPDPGTMQSYDLGEEDPSRPRNYAAQIAYFNCSKCLAGDKSSVIILGPSWYKSITLLCVSEMYILSPQSHGQREQTEGRAIRRCSFEAVQDRSHWEVSIKSVLIRGTELKCDAYLRALNDARGTLENSLLKIMRRLSFACTAFKSYSGFDIDCGDENNEAEYVNDDLSSENFFRCDKDISAIVPFTAGEPSVRLAITNNLSGCSRVEAKKYHSGDDRSRVHAMQIGQHTPGHHRALL